MRSIVIYALLWISTLCFCQSELQTSDIDETMTPGASGVDVVDACIQQIQKVFPEFGPNYGFMKRLALMESQFGTDQEVMNSNPSGGIWQITSYIYDAIRIDNTSRTILENAEILFGKEVADISINNFSVPLRSAFAARLFLSQFHGPFRIPKTVGGQAKWWSQIYHPGQSAGEFLHHAKEQDTREKCSLDKIDLWLVLDGSWNIKYDEFEKTLSLFRQVANSIVLTPNIIRDKLNVDTFHRYFVAYVNEIGNTDFSVATNQSDFSKVATDNSSTTASSNNLAEYLKTGVRSPTEGIPRVVILVTDANHVSTLQDPIAQVKEEGRIVFLFGIGRQFNRAAMQKLSSGGGYTNHYREFSRFNFAYNNRIIKRICQAAFVLENGTQTTVNIQAGKVRFFRAKIPASGSIELQFELQDPSEGVTYLSSNIRHPNKALHDFAFSIKKGITKIELSNEEDGKLTLTPSRQKRNTKSISVPNTIYFSHQSINDTEYKLHITATEIMKGATSDGTTVSVTTTLSQSATPTVPAFTISGSSASNTTFVSVTFTDSFPGPNLSPQTMAPTPMAGNEKSTIQSGGETKFPQHAVGTTEKQEGLIAKTTEKQEGHAAGTTEKQGGNVAGTTEKKDSMEGLTSEKSEDSDTSESAMSTSIPISNTTGSSEGRVGRNFASTVLPFYFLEFCALSFTAWTLAVMH